MPNLVVSILIYFFLQLHLRTTWVFYSWQDTIKIPKRIGKVDIYIYNNKQYVLPRVLFVQTDWNFFPICAILLRKFEALGGNKDERKQLLWELQKRMSDYAPALGFSACPWDKARWGQIVAFSNQRYQPSSLLVLPKDTYPVLLFSCFCFGSYIAFWSLVCLVAEEVRERE